MSTKFKKLTEPPLTEHEMVVDGVRVGLLRELDSGWRFAPVGQLSLSLNDMELLLAKMRKLSR